MPYAFGLPATYLVDDVGRTLDSAKPVTHQMTKAVHGATAWYIWLHPFVQRGTGRISVSGFRFVVPGKSELAVSVLREQALGGP